MKYIGKLWRALNLVNWLSDGTGEINFKFGDLNCNFIKVSSYTVYHRAEKYYIQWNKFVLMR